MNKKCREMTRVVMLKTPLHITSSLSILKKHLKSQIGHAEKPLWDQMWPAKGFSAWPLWPIRDFLYFRNVRNDINKNLFVCHVFQQNPPNSNAVEIHKKETNFYLELSCCKKQQKSPNQESGLRNRGCLKVLNDT